MTRAALEAHVWNTGYAWGELIRRFYRGEVTVSPEVRAEIERRRAIDNDWWASVLYPKKIDVTDGMQYDD